MYGKVNLQTVSELFSVSFFFGSFLLPACALPVRADLLEISSVLIQEFLCEVATGVGGGTVYVHNRRDIFFLACYTATTEISVFNGRPKIGP